MYESDEWYLQYEPDKDPRAIQKMNGKTKENPAANQTIADTVDFWNLDSSIVEKR